MKGLYSGLRRVFTCFVVVMTVILNLTALAGAEQFLKGNFVEVGINNAGSFGTSGGAPAGFHPTNGGLGFVADPGRDGWAVGSPRQTGDYFVPGAPEEGWMVEWTSGGVEKQFHNFGLMGEFDVPMATLINTSSGDTRSAIWEGTAVSGNDRLRITQTVSFNVNDLFFTMNVVLTNVGTTTLNSLEYMRNVDPDQEQPLSGNFTTKNWVEFQPVRSGVSGRPALAARPAGNGNKALAIAEGLAHRLTLGLGTIDPRAVVAASHGFSNRDTDSILNSPIQPTTAVPSIQDAAIALGYDLGSLAPGQSTSVTYAYILNKADLDAAMGNLAAVTILQPTGTVSGTNVLFQATTDKVANTTRMDFFVNGQLIGTDNTPDAGGVFEAAFDSLAFPNGIASLKAVATFTAGTPVEKTSSVSVDNSGPAIAFSTPAPGQVFAGGGIPVAIQVLDAAHPPVRVSFFRETAGTGSLFLGEDVVAPFTSSFDVTGLPQGETVVIKAVAYDSLGRVSSIAVSGTTHANRAPIADAGVDLTAACTRGGAQAILNGLGSSDPDGDPLTYSWSSAFATESGPAPTLLFGLGSHNVTLTVSDSKGATAVDTVTVSIVDTTPPMLSAGPDVILEATSPEGAAFTPTPVASDSCCDVNLLVSPRPAFYPLGTTRVNVSAIDCATNETSDSLVVTVVDTTAPVVIAPPDMTVEAGALLTPVTPGAATATDAVGVASVVSDAPAAFPVGTTIVTWTARDAAGNSSSALQKVTVTDTAPPVVNAPADITVEAAGALTAVAPGMATATDTVGVISVESDAPAAFPVGTTIVIWTAKDAAGNSSSANQTVTVIDTTPPVVSAPADITVEAAGALTAVAPGMATATDAVGVISVVSDAPAAFPVGTTIVIWTAKDAAGNSSSANQTVTVKDTTPPVVNVPADITAEAGGTLTVVDPGMATASDAVGVISVVSDAPAAFPVGTTIVTWTAKDEAGNSSSAKQNVTVKDTTPPVVTAPADITVEAAVTLTTVAPGMATATDAVGVISVVSDAPAAFPVGTTIITWTAKDEAGNSSSAKQNVTVKDTTPPVLSGLVNQVLEAASAGGVAASFTVTAADLVTATPSVVCTPARGSLFAIGTTMVTCSATDAAGNSASGSFTIKVQDTQAPVLTAPADIRVLLNTASTAPAIQAFLAGVSAADKVDANVAITYNMPDLTSAGPKKVTFTATDDFGNISQVSATIWVNYGVNGFLPPVSLGKPINLGSTVPVKFQLTDAQGAIVTSATAKLMLQKFSNNEPVGEPIMVTSTSGADSGNYFRLSDGMYMYNLNTKGLSTGLYQIQAALDDGGVNTIMLSLK